MGYTVEYPYNCRRMFLDGVVHDGHDETLLVHIKEHTKMDDWKVIDPSDNGWGIIPAETEIEDYSGNLIAICENKNASLIAAAPAMLEVLREVAQGYSTRGSEIARDVLRRIES